MKILTILGARPQFIKSACLNRHFKNHATINEIIVHTGQHYDHKMSAVFFEELGLSRPDYQLKCSHNSRFEMLASMLDELQKIISDTKPDATLVYGDTNSTLAGALISSKYNIPIIHIEAGLRSFNTQMPEESNRIVTDRLSKLLFCPTQTALKNLQNEGLNDGMRQIFVCGDLMQDNAMYYAQFAKKPPISIHSKFVLATLHRVQNTNDPKRLQAIWEALQTIASKTQVILPLHPRTANALKIQKLTPASITVTHPLSYLETLWMLQNTECVITDSGGLQKEAYFCNKPCLILRDESEWEELIQTGCAILLGANKEKIIESFGNMPYLFKKPFPPHLYGKGNAGSIITQKILETL